MMNNRQLLLGRIPVCYCICVMNKCHKQTTSHHLKFLPPALMMASAHCTTSSSYSPLFTTRTSIPSLLNRIITQIFQIPSYKMIQSSLGFKNVAVTSIVLPQALHDVLHIVGMDVVSFKQAAVARALCC